MCSKVILAIGVVVALGGVFLLGHYENDERRYSAETVASDVKDRSPLGAEPQTGIRNLVYSVGTDTFSFEYCGRLESLCGNKGWQAALDLRDEIDERINAGDSQLMREKMALGIALDGCKQYTTAVRGRRLGKLMGLSVLLTLPVGIVLIITSRRHPSSPPTADHQAFVMKDWIKNYRITLMAAIFAVIGIGVGVLSIPLGNDSLHTAGLAVSYPSLLGVLVAMVLERKKKYAAARSDPTAKPSPPTEHE